MESKTSSRPSSSSSSHPQSPDSTIYHIYFDNIVHTNFTITKSPAKQTPLYYVQNSYFTPNTPDMTLHAGTNQSGPLLAQCKFVLFSTGTKIGLGNGVDDMIWEDLTRESKDHSRYRYEIDLDMDEDESGNVTVSKKRSRPRRAFLWKRTHSVGVDDSMPSKLSTSNFKLVEEETGEVVAVFANNGAKSWRKKGKLEILHKEGLVGKGRRFELMVLMGALAVVERERRRGMQWRYDQL
ncbi:hypothetical protein AJ79_01367 [Helicocarpus griseus UAMH5409]|uniref:Uncharacterized protein n=1 Tax=Helicocarpus griseus UAMH5409 TaxID=1447875 RepID=A0A2B7Y7G9_9EURO|nr:hypothetical protein AJ79_01367 [Helicocarpus griseus UAMH5409]